MLPSLLADEGPAPQPEGVGFWLRALAQLIDLLVHYAVSFAAAILTVLFVSILAVVVGGDVEAAVKKMTATTAWAFLAALLGSLCLHVFSEGLHGSTIGKRICGITVWREDGGPAGLVAALKRGLAFYVDSLFFGVIAFHKMAQSSRNQRIGDTWARTVVVRISALDPADRRSGLRFVGAAAVATGADGLFTFVQMAFQLF